ncbi:helix-turn-helix transcriptional regulator [Lactiplantibacillus carotarum]|uniref:helix-turn-helix transcriptional regulator n=1 Tax=Lactiplantibacillus carotarum TaxID=2993456 RepID=UPI00298F1565|nr:AraC family transcriptional regulator [Lactiplantibacillus carotarum]
MNNLLYTHYLDQLNNYDHQSPDKKAIILLGYTQRDFLRYYRRNEVQAGFEFIKRNIERNRHLIATLSPEQRTSQMHSFVDDLAHVGIKNHVEIYPFLELQQAYHRRLQTMPVNNYVVWIQKVIHDFSKLMDVDGLSFSSRLESTLDIIYYINAHIYDKIAVKDVLQHANQYCNPTRAQRNFSQEMHMSISDFIMGQRMDLAKTLLTKTDTSVQSIAAKLNFYDANDFSKQFKRKLGLSPLTYRKTYQ